MQSCETSSVNSFSDSHAQRSHSLRTASIFAEVFIRLLFTFHLDTPPLSNRLEPPPRCYGMIGNLATCAYYFGWIAGLATLDLAASSALTCEQLGWNPTGPDLLTDPREMDYS